MLGEEGRGLKGHDRSSKLTNATTTAGFSAVSVSGGGSRLDPLTGGGNGLLGEVSSEPSMIQKKIGKGALVMLSAHGKKEKVSLRI